ncbi:MAG: Unknown protein [uncultured Sulfurovum sp.]|uniref:Uncharacterized protein n=1 Tax=uncultured Sulfurovum sp. TaxID=269237 RepID=A0A6S6U6R1_9BACT|nr:MAG: Unknown protein [uncultured Sulfurovum sp.]
MKKIYWLTLATIVTLWSQETRDLERLGGGLVGGSCEYREYSVIAKIVSIVDKPTRDCKKAVEVKYRFNEKSVLPQYLNSETIYSIHDETHSMGISKEYALSKGLTIESVHNVKISELINGTCTPMITKFTDIDFSDQKNYCQDSESKSLNPWRKFSRLEYKNSDYTLREDVDYFELRKYIFDMKTNKQVSKKYIPYSPIYRKKLSSYPKKIVSNFQNISFDNQKLTHITTFGTGAIDYIFKVYGFVIKKDNKFWTINEKKDFVWLFNKIDTEAELSLILRLNNMGKDSYRKTSNGYDVKRNKIEHKVSKITKGDFDEYTEYEIHRTYIYHITSNGKFTEELISTMRKNEKKSRVSVDFHPDPVPPIFPPPPIPLEVVLKDKKFITPSSY